MHAPSEEKSDDSQDSFHVQLDQAVVHFSHYYMKILLRDFTANDVGENIFKPTIKNESLHQDSNTKGIIIVNFATLKKFLC